MDKIFKGQIRVDEPPGQLISIRNLNVGDVPRIREISREGFSRLWGPEDFVRFIEHPASFSHGLCEGIVPVSRLQSFLIGLLVEGDLDIISIVTSLEMRTRGYGRRLIGHAQNEDCVRRILLEVETGNIAAIALYEKTGFRVKGRRLKYYHQGKDALVMAWEKGG